MCPQPSENVIDKIKWTRMKRRKALEGVLIPPALPLTPSLTSYARPLRIRHHTENI